MALWQRLQTGLNAVYPARCLTCGDVVDSDFGLCGPCWRDTAFIGGTICDSCGVPLPGQADGEALHCDACMQSSRPWSHGRAALIYRDTGRKLVLALKHGDRQEIARPAARWMARVVPDIVTPDMLIVPVPLHWRRMMKRRYNQSALLARALARELNCETCLDLLQRHRATRSLEGLGRDDRAAVVEGAIRMHPKRAEIAKGRPLLLVDDVMTSGATLAAATLAGISGGSGPICVVTLARVAKDT